MRRGLTCHQHFGSAASAGDVGWSQPIPDEPDNLDEVLSILTEARPHAISARRLHTVTELAAHLAVASRAEEVCRLAVDTLAKNHRDVPFAYVYLYDWNGQTAQVCGATRPPGDEKWPLDEFINEHAAVFLEARSAFIAPLRGACEARPLGALVAGANPDLTHDEDLRAFVDQVAGLISSALIAVRIRAQADKHTEIGVLQDRALQIFFVIGLVAQAALDRLSPDYATDPLAAALAEIMEVAATGTHFLREALVTLDHADIEESGMIDALRRLVRGFQQRTEIEAELLVTGAYPQLPFEIAEALLHAAAEALASVERHSRAGAVLLRLDLAGRGVTLSIYDDGVAQPRAVLKRMAGNTTHFGLSAVAERVRRLGGELVAHAPRDGGFVVRISLPLQGNLELQGHGNSTTVALPQAEDTREAQRAFA